MSDLTAIITPMKLKRSNDRKVANLSQKMESKPQLLTRSVSPLERLTHALVPLVFVRVFATQENSKSSSRE
jgi:hypothetical protein